MNAVKNVDLNIYRALQAKQEQTYRDKIPKPVIVAFGTLDEVYVAEILPRAMPLLSAERPPYI